MRSQQCMFFMRWNSPKLIRKYLRFWLMAGGVVIALLLFAEIVDDVFYDPLEGDIESQVFDQAIGSWASQIRTPELTQIMTDFTAMGSVSVLATLLIIFTSILASFRDLKGIAYLVLVGFGASVWTIVLKSYFNRARPSEAEHLVMAINLSFPSGHALGAAAIYISLAYYAGQYASSWKQELFFYWLGAALVLIVGISRIYLGVHYPTDVLAGLCGGIAWGFFASAIYELHFKA